MTEKSLGMAGSNSCRYVVRAPLSPSLGFVFLYIICGLKGFTSQGRKDSSHLI